jgi:DNA-binding PadR family transcriptional regulator
MGSQEPRITAQTLKVLRVFMSQLDDEISGAEIYSATGVASGTLYPLLIRLESVGWVESRWEDEKPQKLGRPRRRLYRVTDVGAKKARAAFREIVQPLKEFAWQ